MDRMAVATDDVLAAVAPELDGLAAHEAEAFGLRVARWWADLVDALAVVHQPEVVDDLAERLVRSAARAYAEREPELKRLDQVRLLEPDWFQHPRMLGYAAYADRFAGDLRGVADHVRYLRHLGVTYLHLMPLLLPRPGDQRRRVRRRRLPHGPPRPRHDR